MAFAGNNDAERIWLKRIAAAGIVIITIGLCFLNTTGAHHASDGNWFYTVCVAGAEILAAVVFGLVVLARTWVRRIAGVLIFVVLVWACIENGKLAIQQSFSDVFVGTPSELREKARIADETAIALKANATEDRDDSKEDKRALREEKARLVLELDLMTSNVRIEEAQTRLKAMGLYTGPIDGIRAELTEMAMEARGEAINRRIAIIDALIDPTVSEETVEDASDVALSPSDAKRLEAIQLRTQADEVEYRTVWMHVILIAFEGARSFGVWAFLMTSTATGTAAAFTTPQPAKEEDDPEEQITDAETEPSDPPEAPDAEDAAEPANDEETQSPEKEEEISGAGGPRQPDGFDIDQEVPPQRKPGLARAHYARRGKVRIPMDDVVSAELQEAAE
ncbi:MAG: hypothetical protein CL583_13210 [Alteromonadaceae bacterium]|nr:hypothetical protein [Alteromonadaceae bacterium]|tara:strand:+ start:974 stop:2152 length:1179 start_codon:yes stop_codon:yes gene_type:complete